MVHIITIKEGTPYDQAAMDMAVIMTGDCGDTFLDRSNCFKKDTEIILKRKQKQ